MTAGDIAILLVGALIAVFVAWTLWPRRRPWAGPGNNWRQRSGDEIESGKTRPEGIEGVSNSIVYGAQGE